MCVHVIALQLTTARINPVRAFGTGRGGSGKEQWRSAGRRAQSAEHKAQSAERRAQSAERKAAQRSSAQRNAEQRSTVTIRYGAAPGAYKHLRAHEPELHIGHRLMHYKKNIPTARTHALHTSPAAYTSHALHLTYVAYVTYITYTSC